ncbi:MAG: Ger(x)C family spore germination protein [Firmicutes bacterium]|nr:Ger(x)C family spore germination protein [Bacillota bacterium]
MPQLSRRLILATLGMILLLLGGCWNRREVETLAFIMAAGVDQAAEPDKVQLTVQIALPAALVTATGGSGASERAFWLVSSTGYTPFDATRNFASQSSRRLFWAHNRWLVIGEEMARDGIEDILDMFVRDGETRRTVKVAVSKGGKASDFLQTELEMERLSSEAYVGILQNSSTGLSTVVDIDIHRFLLALAGEGIEPVAIRAEMIDRLPDVDIRGQLERSTISLAPRITGAAVFRESKLVGWLDKPEARGYNWVLGKAKSSLIIIERPEDETKYVGIELMRAGSKIKPEIVDGRPRMTVKIQAEGAIGDIEDMFMITDSLGAVASMERRMATVIANDVNAALQKARELGSDIFGFGQAIYRRYPKEWSSWKDNWNDQGFQELEVKVEVESKIRRSGLIEVGVPLRR